MLCRFPAFRIRSSVYPYLGVPLQDYVRITFIRKNSLAYVENNVLRCRKFAVSVQIGSSSVFRICSRHGTETATALRNGSADTDNGNGYG